MTMYFKLLIIICAVLNAQCTEELQSRLVYIDQGPVRGFKKPGEKLYSFYNIPFATVKERFKMAEAPPTWTEPFDAVKRNIICPQGSMVNVDITNMTMQEDCLVVNVFVPDTNDTNINVLVDIQSGAFFAGYGTRNMFNTFAAIKKVIVVSFNYRIGTFGFTCLGTEKIPGNTGLKDQITALRWIKRNIASFGGNPNDITVSGCSAGGSSLDLILLSKMSEGLFHKAIVDGGSNLAPYLTQFDPIRAAKKQARSYHFKDFNNLEALEQFFVEEPFETFTKGSYNAASFLDYGPCLERDVGQEIFLNEAPLTTLRRGDEIKVPIMYGLTNMEGKRLMSMFNEWSQMMNKDFSTFLPGDLQFNSEAEKQRVAQTVKKFYFGNKPVSNDTILEYIQFISDTLYTYPILRKLRLKVEAGRDKMFLYEFSYYEKDDRLKGADHCAQLLAVKDQDETKLTEDYKKVKALMRDIWYNYITTGNPVVNGYPVQSWPTVGRYLSPHLSIARSIELRGPLMQRQARFWDRIYKHHYRSATPPRPEFNMYHENIVFDES